MAATVKTPEKLTNWPYSITAVQVSTIDPGVDLDVSHGGPTGVAPDFATWELVERPTTRDVVFVEFDRENDSTANDTARVSIDTVALGDLTGAVVRLVFHFISQGSGGIS